MVLAPEPMLLYVLVTAVGYALLWRWWWTTIEHGDVELSYSEERIREAGDSSERRDGDAEIRSRDE